MSTVDVTTLLRAGAPHAPETLRMRVLALEPQSQPRAAWRSRRLALVVLPAAAGIAVAAAVVHGLLGSGSTTQTVATPTIVRGLPADVRGGAGAGAAKAPAFNGSFSAVEQHAVAATPSIAARNRLQHTDASLQVRVPSTQDLSTATTRATQIATALGGYAESVQYRTPQGGGGESFIELRVPAQNVKLAIARLAGLGTLVSQQLSVSDLQQRFETQSAQIAQLRRRVAALQAALRNPALPEAQRVLLQIQLSEAKRALSQRLHARKGTIAAGTTARISLVLGTQKAIVVPHHRGRLGRMVHSAVGFLALEGIIVLVALIVVSPLALAGFLIWLWRRRSVERFLAA
jgi:hypothetical protein